MPSSNELDQAAERLRMVAAGRHWDAYDGLSISIDMERSEEVDAMIANDRAMLANAYLAGQRGVCPCTIADAPCHTYCTCIKGHSSYGCWCCARYGSDEQRKAAANRIVERMRGERELKGLEFVPVSATDDGMERLICETPFGVYHLRGRDCDSRDECWSWQLRETDYRESEVIHDHSRILFNTQQEAESDIFTHHKSCVAGLYVGGE